MFENKKSVILLLVSVCIIGVGGLEIGNAISTWKQNDAKKYKYTVVVDAGHGGYDPGKIGINNAKEKDVNLAVATILKKEFEKRDCRVIMTRTEDVGLYEDGASSKKISDLNNRCKLIDGSGADVTISIHQNSFSDASSHGAQVFFQTTSEEGKKLADILQDALKTSLTMENHRVAKANSTYFMLKKTKSIMVIVECGFLSNAEEAALLCKEKYQEQLAKAIAKGTLQYLEEKAKK